MTRAAKGHYTRFLPFFIAAFAGGTAQAAVSSDDTTVVLVPVRVAGDFPDEFKASLNAGLERAATFESYNVLKATNAPADGCRDRACLRSALVQTSAQFLIAASVGTAERDFNIAVHLYDKGGNLKAKSKSTCEICTFDEAVEALEQEVTKLKPTIDDLVANPYGDRAPERMAESGPSRLVFRSNPPGATVQVDGQKVGKTPYEMEVAAGPHQIVISKKGYISEESFVRAPRGATERLRFELTQNQDRQNKTLRGVAWGGTFGGLALLGGGIALLALDERPYRQQCDGLDRDVNGACRFRYNTLVPGAVLTAVGLAGLIAGISTAVILYGRKRKQASSVNELDNETISVVPVLSPSNAGVRVRF